MKMNLQHYYKTLHGSKADPVELNLRTMIVMSTTTRAILDPEAEEVDGRPLKIQIYIKVEHCNGGHHIQIALRQGMHTPSVGFFRFLCCVGGKRYANELAIELPVVDLLGTTLDTGPSGGDLTNLGTRGLVSLDSGWVTNVLVVTTTVRMLNRVHGTTTDLWPFVTLGLELVVSGTCLQEWFVDTTTTSNQTNHSTGNRVNGLLLARRELDTGFASIWVVCDDGAVVAGASCEDTTVTSLCFDVANDGALWHGIEREDVSDVQGSLLTGVNELTSGHTFGADEGLV
jgi:hypothetical protein